jgi:hypothetical protein
VQSPFTAHPVEAFSIVQTATAGALTAVVLYRPLRPLVSSALFLAAVWLTALFADAVALVVSLGAHFHEPPTLITALKLSAFLATVAMTLARPHWIGLIAFLGEVCLAWLCKYVVDGDQGLGVLHLTWFGALLGAHQLLDERQRGRRDTGERRHFRPGDFLGQDLALGALAVVFAWLVATFVNLRECASADEWAYTYQASLFAKLRAFGHAPQCASAFRMFWVFSAEGRTFSQYTPGWPLFMAPFVALGLPWFAAPACFGILAVGIAHLARRAARGASGRADVVEAAGPIAALFTMTASTVLINAGSRYSHILVATCFAWSVEALAELASGGGGAPPNHETGDAAARLERDDARTKTRWGIVLGVCASWLLSTRPGDGATLGIGLFLYFVIALVRRRFEWRPVVAAAVAFVLWGGVTLVILRLQLGKWFATGYSLARDYYDYAEVKFSWPKPNEIRMALPIGTGSYCWWPLSPALGLGGLVAALRPRSRGLAFMLAVGTLVCFTLYFFSELGRGWDFGYGPRYYFPSIVPMAVGTGVLLAPLWAAARKHVHPRRALLVGGPALLAIAAAVYGGVRLAPLLYPYSYDDTKARSAVNDAIRKEQLTNAIVWIQPGTTFSDARDLTQNYPFELYPSDAILAIDAGDDARRCVTTLFPGRRQYRAVGAYETKILPE